MKIRISLILGILLSSLGLLAQSPDVSGLEYFIDDDPGVRNGTTVDFTDGDSIDFDFTVDISGESLTPGFHFLFIRTYDANGNTGITQSRKFFVQSDFTPPTTASNVTSGEYFINDDPGPGMGNPFTITAPGDSIDEDFTVDLSGESLSEGFHWLFLRTRDADGRWSITHSRKFYIMRVADPLALSVDIQSIEYFIDDDPGPGNGDLLDFTFSGDSIDQDILVPIGTLTSGFHQLGVRVLDQNGKWSIVQQRKFYVLKIHPIIPTSANIKRIEYFIGPDPGVGGATLVTDQLDADSVDQDFIVDLTGIESGTDTLHVRVIDAAGVASVTAFAEFDILGNAIPTITEETFEINENLTNGSVVGTVEAIDLDDDPITFAFATPNETFAIDANSGEITVLDSTALDFETNPTFSVTVQATDDNEFTGEGIITIELTDVNEAPSITVEDVTIQENLENESLITTISGSDPESDIMVFSISSGNDDGIFLLDALSGALTVQDSTLLDFETMTAIELIIEVTDGELTSEGMITITITDVFENTDPSVENPIEDKTFSEGFGTSTVNLTNVFDDADGHTLTFSASSDDEDVVTVSVSGVTLTITEVGLGTANVTITADDGNDGEGTDEFVVVVEIPVLSVSGPHPSAIIYPNPVIEYFKLSMSQQDFVNMKIFSLDGRLVRQFDAYMDRFKLDNLKAGVYTVIIQSSQTHTLTRIVVAE